MVYDKEIMIKIEPNLVLRGSVFDCETRGLCQRAQDQFLQFTRVKTLSFADLYGGKICAALSRQHPRDLFDIKILLENEGLTEEVKQAFLVYLVSNPRPMSELLDPSANQEDFSKNFTTSFSGMTQFDVTCDELFATRNQLIHGILRSLTNNERQFLLSIKSGEPDWSLLPISSLENFPAIEWKLVNIRKMDKQKRTLALEKLKNILEI